MKDYSRFFSYPAAFVKKVTVNQKRKEIYVTVKNAGVTNKLTYPLNKDILDKLNNILVNQYIEAVNNKKDILKNNQTSLILLMTLIPLGFTTYLTNDFNLSIIMYMTIVLEGTNILGIVINELVKKHERDTLRVYEAFLNERNRMNKAIYEEKNIVKCIKNAKTEFALDEQISLGKKGLVNELYNSLFIDSASIKDLKRMSEVLKIYESMSKENIYSEEDTKVKRLTNK